MAEEEIAALLRPWLGARLLSQCPVCRQADMLLTAFDTAQGDWEALYRRLDTLLFRTVREMTRGDMRVALDDGRLMRVRVDDIDQMADELLYVPMRRLTHSAYQCQRLRGYAMTHDSLSALRALYVDFAAFQSEDERRLIARTVRENHTPYRWRSWLGE